MVELKPVVFLGRSLDDLRRFPSIGRGAQEIRIRDASGAFRVIYVAKFGDAVYVLHCFQKKTRETGNAVVSLATRRYRDLTKERGE